MKVAVSEKLSKICSQELLNTLLKRNTYTTSCLKTASHPLDRKLIVDLDADVMIRCVKRMHVLSML